MKGLLRTLTGLVLIAALSSGQRTFAQEPASTSSHPEAPHITLRVDLVTTTLPGDIKTAVEDELAKQLEALGAELGFEVTDSTDSTLLLQLEYSLPDHKNVLYVHRALVFRNGELLERADTRTCLRCTPAELVTKSLDIVPRVITLAIELQPEPVEPPAPTVEPEEVVQLPAPPTPTPEPGPLTFAGGPLVGAGFVGIVMGSVLLERGVEPIPPTFADRRNYSKPGGVVLGLGLGSVAVGVVLLLVDAWMVAPRRSGQQGRLSQVRLGRDGLLLGGRF